MEYSRRKTLMKKPIALLISLVTTAALAFPALAAGGDVLVSNGSPTTPFPQNKQNEPTIAIDPLNGNIMVAGSNDEIDLGPCAGSNCPFTQGVGVSGIYFSKDGGATWTQPTYTGWSARNGTPGKGPIGTLPWYYENGLVSDGDPVVAFGPKPGANGGFSWSNGARLYYSNLTSNFSASRQLEAFKGVEAIAVSRTDNIAAAAANDKSAWMAPVVISKQSSATFSDKETIWADNAASSPYFGNVYVCNVAFRSLGGAPEPVVFLRSTDGGNTWTQQQISQAANTYSGAGRSGGRQGCTIRTDSKGTVYLFWDGSYKTQSVQWMARSYDGGVKFEKAQPVATITEVGKFDPLNGENSFDGIAGARTDSFPIVDIANGAPSGAGATNRIVMIWSDGSQGLNKEEALVQTSTDGGNSWSKPVNAAEAGDRPDFPAIAISPDGQNVYVTYMAFLDPWRSNTSSARRMQGVVRQAAFSDLSSWTTLQRGAVGDARASSANSLASEFLGDYDAIAANNTQGAAVWNDVRNASVCPAVNAWRQSLANGTPTSKPAPASDCPATFGNTDIFGGTYTP
jgi:hypothetical protein